MTIRHHPPEELLLAYASGSLGRGASLVAHAHLGACSACRQQVEQLEAVGGALLDGLPAAEMAEDALARTLARLDAPANPRARRPAASAPKGLDLAEALDDLPLGPRRWLGPGIWMRSIVKDGPSTAYLLRSGPRQQFARHSHRGAEYVCVIKGAFSDETGHYGPGDFALSDDSVTHSPMSDADGECLCLIYADDRMRMRGVIGAILQPFVGL